MADPIRISLCTAALSSLLSLRKAADIPDVPMSLPESLHQTPVLETIRVVLVGPGHFNSDISARAGIDSPVTGDLWGCMI